MAASDASGAGPPPRDDLPPLSAGRNREPEVDAGFRRNREAGVDLRFRRNREPEVDPGRNREPGVDPGFRRNREPGLIQDSEGTRNQGLIQGPEAAGCWASSQGTRHPGVRFTLWKNITENQKGLRKIQSSKRSNQSWFPVPSMLGPLELRTLCES